MERGAWASLCHKSHNTTTGYTFCGPALIFHNSFIRSKQFQLKTVSKLMTNVNKRLVIYCFAVSELVMVQRRGRTGSAGSVHTCFVVGGNTINAFLS